MKKLFSIAILLAISSAINAQQKPSKEETVSFISRTVNLTVGKRMGAYTQSSAAFTGESYEYADYLTKQLIFTHKYTGISWENLNPQSVNLLDNRDPAIVSVSACFSKKVKMEESDNSGDEAKEEFADCIAVVIPKDKFESIKKAFLRLSEIAKEENKDPFQN